MLVQTNQQMILWQVCQQERDFGHLESEIKLMPIDGNGPLERNGITLIGEKITK